MRCPGEGGSEGVATNALSQGSSNNDVGDILDECMNSLHVDDAVPLAPPFSWRCVCRLPQGW